MSLCDQCYAPGACCKGINIFGGANDATVGPRGFGADGNEYVIWADLPLPELAKLLEGMGVGMLAPIARKVLGNVEGRDYYSYTFRCTWLLPNGRCGGYDERPFMCSDFPAGEDRLCVHFQGAEGYAG